MVCLRARVRRVSGAVANCEAKPSEDFSASETFPSGE